MAHTEEHRPLDMRELRAAVRALRPGGVVRLDRAITVDEFCALYDDRSLELVEGAIYLSPPPTDSHENFKCGWAACSAYSSKSAAWVRCVTRVPGARESHLAPGAGPAVLLESPA